MNNGNPILAALNQRPAQTQNNGLKAMVDLYKNSQNPNQVLNYLSQTNPQLQSIMNMVGQNGGNAQSMFYLLARQKGIDPDAFLNNLKTLF